MKRKRKQTDSQHRSTEYNQRTKRRQTGDEDRKDEFKQRSRKRRSGDEHRNLSADIKRKGQRRDEGDIVRNRSADIRRQAERRAARRLVPVHPIWTSDALPTDEQLKHFDKDPTTAVAAFRLMAGIPPDPRNPSAKLDFHIN